MYTASLNILVRRVVLALLVGVVALRSDAVDVRLAWDAPSNPETLAGYTLSYGVGSRQYSSSTNVNATTVLVTGLNEGVTYYFAVTSISTNGSSSDFSAEISHHTADPLPIFPTLGPVFITQNTNSGAIPINMGLNSSALTGWSLQANSSNPSVIRDASLTLGGTGNNRWLLIIPETGALGSSTITLRVTEGTRTNTTSFLATVSLPNSAPAIDPGTNVTIRTGTTHMLRPRVVDDGLPLVPGRVSATWSKISGPGTVTFGNSNFVVTTVRFSLPGIYKLRLSVTDGDLSSSVEPVVRVQTIIDNTPPLISDFAVTEVTATTVTLSWVTDELTDEQVHYTPEFEAPKNTFLNPIPRLQHLVTVTNLVPSTTYSFMARSRDGSSNKTNSETVQLTTLSLSSVALAIAQVAAQGSAPAGYAYDGEDRPVNTSDSAEFRFEAPSAGIYYVWARVQAPANLYQAFQVSLDATLTDWFDAPDGSWRSSAKWVLLNGRDGQAALTLSPRLLRLSAAAHVLRFTGTSAAKCVSQVLVTSDPKFVPEPTQNQPIFVIPIRSGWSMVACPLEGPTDDIESLMPAPPAGTVFYKWNPDEGVYNSNLFDGVEWEKPEMVLSPGEGGLIYNPDASFDWVITGRVNASGASSNSLLTEGLSFVALPTPRSGLLRTLLPGFVFKSGDALFRMNPDGETYQTYRFDGLHWDILPTLNLGEAFFLSLVPR